MREGECLACEATAGRTTAPGGAIYDDGLWRVEHSLAPVLLRGWLVAKPIRHVEHIAELSDPETRGLGPILRLVSSAMRATLGAERVYVCSFGELVHHVHFYLLPRYAGMPASGIDVLQRMFSSERPWACPADEAGEAAAKVRQHIRMHG